MYYEGNFVAD